MKHLKLFPLLIAAAFALPRAHAAEAGGAQNEPSSYGAGLLCVSLVLLAAGRSRHQIFKSDNR